ncbi:MAG: tetratricopeptide repeat protein [Cytophagaceae bacterium]|nr:tetratricopeptide repeat protein [Cytophagaceae bacterium]
MKTLIFLLLLITTLNGQIQAQSKKTIDSLRAKLPEIEKNDTTFFTTNATFFIPYYFKNNIDSSIYFIEKSIFISKRNKWIESEIGTLNNLAFAYTKKGLYFKSIDINYKALMLAEREKKQAFAYLIKRLLGESYMSLGQYPMAESLLKSSYLDAIKNGDEYEQLANLNQLGNLYKEQKRYIEAEAYYKKALPIAIKMNDKHTLGVAYHNLALSLSLQKKTKEALQLFEKSFALHKSENSYYSLGNLNVDLAELYHSTGDFNKSNKFASDGIKKAN